MVVHLHEGEWDGCYCVDLRSACHGAGWRSRLQGRDADCLYLEKEMFDYHEGNVLGFGKW